MRFLSTPALSIVLAATSVGLLAANPAAAKEKKDDAAPKLQASRDFAKLAQPVQKLIEAKDYAGAQAKLAEAGAAATKPDDKFFMGNFYLNIGLGTKDAAMQRKGVEMMIDSGKSSPEQLVQFEFAAGQLALNAKDWASARTHLTAAIAAGNKTSNPEVLLAESYFGEAYQNVENDQLNAQGRALALQGLPHLKTAIGIDSAAGTDAPASWYTRGLRMAVLSKAPDMQDWFNLVLSHAPTKENWQIALRTMQDNNPNMSDEDSIDLLRLRQQTNSLVTPYAYNQLIQHLWKVGLPGEVKSVLDSGVAAGDIQKDRFGQMYKMADAAIPKDRASLSSSAKKIESASTGKPIAALAGAYLSYGQYDKAAQLYRQALSKGGVDANQVNTRLGISLGESGDYAGAKTAFAAVTGPGLRQQIAEMWTIWANNQATKTAAPATATPAAAPAPDDNSADG